MKRVVIFDLDETLIDSKHRTPNRADGTLDLQKYFEMKNRKSIFEDKLLPLAAFFKALDRKDNYVVICTARAMNQDDYDYLEMAGLVANIILCRPLDGSENHLRDGALKRQKIQRMRNLKQFRNLPFLMWDDASPVIREMRKIGVTCINAIKVNKRLGG